MEALPPTGVSDPAAPLPEPSLATTAPAPSTGAPAEEPVHVSEEPVLVAETADAGVEDGPGPALRVDEPWEGYGEMKAKEVVARLDSASREELAVIELYETTHRGRKTVLSAVERRLRAQSGPASRGS